MARKQEYSVIIKIEADVTQWVSEEEFDEMSDEDIIELTQSDLDELLDKARWLVIRTGGSQPSRDDEDDN